MDLCIFKDTIAFCHERVMSFIFVQGGYGLPCRLYSSPLVFQLFLLHLDFLQTMVQIGGCFVSTSQVSEECFVCFLAHGWLLWGTFSPLLRDSKFSRPARSWR